jgi:hypothetical protein
MRFAVLDFIALTSYLSCEFYVRLSIPILHKYAIQLHICAFWSVNFSVNPKKRSMVRLLYNWLSRDIEWKTLLQLNLLTQLIAAR